jgi:peptide-methionine (R)-S-oxide reductase
MNRRTLLQSLAGLVVLPLLPAILRAQATVPPASALKPSPRIAPLRKSMAAWRALLAPAAYHVLFEEGTERPFTSPLLNEHREGTFVCAACFLPVFESAHKFDSGTGWPSFTQPIVGDIGIKADHKLFEERIECHCARCGGHLGHVFDDGPQPRGERWCINGVALDFVARGRPLPAPRT